MNLYNVVMACVSTYDEKLLEIILDMVEKLEEREYDEFESSRS